jgi:hypothetical protein
VSCQTHKTLPPRTKQILLGRKTKAVNSASQHLLSLWERGVEVVPGLGGGP